MLKHHQLLVQRVPGVHFEMEDEFEECHAGSHAEEIPAHVEGSVVVGVDEAVAQEGTHHLGVPLLVVAIVL